MEENGEAETAWKEASFTEALQVLDVVEEDEGVIWVTPGRLEVLIGAAEAEKAIAGGWYRKKSCPKRGDIYGYIEDQEHKKRTILFPLSVKTWRLLCGMYAYPCINRQGRNRSGSEASSNNDFERHGGSEGRSKSGIERLSTQKFARTLILNFSKHEAA